LPSALILRQLKPGSSIPYADPDPGVNFNADLDPPYFDKVSVEFKIENKNKNEDHHAFGVAESRTIQSPSAFPLQAMEFLTWQAWFFAPGEINFISVFVQLRIFFHDLLPHG
jgi:hypothetical protein